MCFFTNQIVNERIVRLKSSYTSPCFGIESSHRAGPSTLHNFPILIKPHNRRVALTLPTLVTKRYSQIYHLNDIQTY